MSERRVAIVQSNYLPWKGYFDLIAAVDAFILFDDVQYTRRDWRNRNLIKTPNGRQWLTVPVASKHRFDVPIRAIETDGSEWIERHLKALTINHARAPFRDAVLDWVTPILQAAHTHLSPLNRALIERTCQALGIATPLLDSADFELAEGRSGRLVSLCQQAGATCYVSGPAARAYLDVAAFAAAGIVVEWFDYAGYPEYPQQWGAFEHQVTVLDLLMNCGPDAPRYLRTSAR